MSSSQLIMSPTLTKILQSPVDEALLDSALLLCSVDLIVESADVLGSVVVSSDQRETAESHI